MELLAEVVELQTMMDDETYSHCNNVKKAAVYIAEKKKLDAWLLANACAILDVGKLMINEYVFHKAELLSETERELMDLHSYLGYKMCLDYGIPGKIAEIILYHHGEDKPRLGQVPAVNPDIREYCGIVHTMDVFEALTEERGYRKRYSKDAAYRMMEKESEKESYRMDVLELLYETDL